MELSPLEQAAALLRQSTTPLILLPATPSSDALAAGLALLLILGKLGQAAKIVSPDFTLPPHHDFLPQHAAIEQRLTSLRNFTISVDVSRTKLDSLSYDLRDDRLHIYLAPKQGFYEAQDVTTSAGAFAHDLIITLDLPTLAALGPLYHDNTEFFYQVPVLNLDHHAENTRFGHVNLVDVAASSVSELVFELVRMLGFEHLDEQVATSLLTGIISKTKVFQNQRVTPKSLAVASHLMSAGARRDEIVRHLYQTKTLPTLKLWGRALGRLQSTPDGRVIWTTITADDLAVTGTKAEDATGVMDELMTEAAATNVTCLFVETDEEVVVHLIFRGAAAPTKLPPQLIRRGPQYLSGRIRGRLTKVAETIIAQL
ncbi:MAG: DHH family phosphoesterase [Patescibacteria group bacterium]